MFLNQQLLCFKSAKPKKKLRKYAEQVPVIQEPIITCVTDRSRSHKLTH